MGDFTLRVCTLKGNKLEPLAIPDLFFFFFPKSHILIDSEVNHYESLEVIELALKYNKLG